MSSCNCCFLTCIQISMKAWYPDLLKNFPQFVVIHTVKGFGIVNKAEVDVFLELSCLFDDPMDVGNLISDSSAFSKSSLNIWFRCSDTSWFRYCWSLAWRILSIALLACEIDYILCSQRWRSSIQSAKMRPGADSGSDHELLIVKFRLILKKVEKTTRPFRYDLIQIPYDDTVEVTNRFKGLYLIDRVPKEIWTEVCDIVQRAVIKPSSRKNKCRKAKWLSEEA